MCRNRRAQAVVLRRLQVGPHVRFEHAPAAFNRVEHGAIRPQPHDHEAGAVQDAVDIEHRTDGHFHTRVRGRLEGDDDDLVGALELPVTSVCVAATKRSATKRQFSS